MKDPQLLLYGKITRSVFKPEKRVLTVTIAVNSALAVTFL